MHQPAPVIWFISPGHEQLISKTAFPFPLFCFQTSTSSFPLQHGLVWRTSVRPQTCLQSHLRPNKAKCETHCSFPLCSSTTDTHQCYHPQSPRPSTKRSYMDITKRRPQHTLRICCCRDSNQRNVRPSSFVLQSRSTDPAVTGVVQYVQRWEQMSGSAIHRLQRVRDMFWMYNIAALTPILGGKKNEDLFVEYHTQTVHHHLLLARRSLQNFVRLDRRPKFRGTVSAPLDNLRKRLTVCPTASGRVLGSMVDIPDLCSIRTCEEAEKVHVSFQGHLNTQVQPTHYVQSHSFHLQK